jgi:rod shape-determining protein MreD
VRRARTAAALVAAVLAQSVLSLLFPAHARLFDPLLLVVVYSGLTAGESYAMVTGTVAGWVQDALFGGHVLGLSGLTKLVIGYGVGVASSRFHLQEPSARVLVLFAATLVDALLFTRLAEAFNVSAYALSPLGLLSRCSLNAAVGLGVFELVDRRWGRERRRA